MKQAIHDWIDIFNSHGIDVSLFLRKDVRSKITKEMIYLMKTFELIASQRE
ncbi:hypothetical protein GCM10027286_00720 [Virgibacillus ainsalahensis]